MEQNRIPAPPPGFLQAQKKEIALCKLSWYKNSNKTLKVPVQCVHVADYCNTEEDLYKKVVKKKKKDEDWRTLMPSLKEKISYLCLNEVFSDFIITFKHSPYKHFPAHRFILALQSPYFQTLFSGRFPTTGELSAHESVNSVEKVLRYIYKETTPVFDSFSQLLEVMRFADMYMISPLSAVCENHAIECIDGDNACKFFQVAYELNLSDLRECCLEYYDKNFKEFLSSPYFVHLDKSIVLTLYDRAVITQKKEKFTRFLIKWCRNELTRKGKSTDDLSDELEPFFRLHVKTA